MTTIQYHPGHCARTAAMALCLVLAGCRTLGDWTGLFRAPQPPEVQSVESRAFFLVPDQEMIGDLVTIRLRKGDTLPDAARHFGLGYNDIVLANPGVDPWTPPDGSRIALPLRHILPEAPHEGIILNLANMRLFYFAPGEAGNHVFTYSVGIGREGWETPTGITRIANKKVNPSWVPPASIRKEQAANGNPLPRVVPPGPDNPLGDFAMRLSIPSYLIHGTNKPYGVGMRVSHGCVRLYPEDIEKLFARVAVGDPVLIIDQPYLAGWQAGVLYLEAHAPVKGKEKQAEAQLKTLFSRIEKRALDRGAAIDWKRVDEVLQRQDGIPAPILENSPDLGTMKATAQVVAHPETFFGQPVGGFVDANRWSINVASFDKEADALRVAAMLNHQGPPIPSRPLRADRSYQVIAGPFEDREQALAAAERIRRDFEFDAQPVAPNAETD